MEENNQKQPLQSPQIIGILPRLEFETDDVDVPPKTPCITYWDLFLLVSSIIMHIVDMGIDLNLAVRYLLANKITYFIWTTVFIFLPSFANVVISRRMQHQDEKAIQDRPAETKFMRIMLEKSLCFIVTVLFQLAPVLRYYQTLKYAWKVRKCERSGDRNGQRRYYIKMLKEDQDVALLRVFECFIEAAPQQVLQLAILLKHYHNKVNFEFVHQVASIVSSLGSMGWAMASYHRSIRLAQFDKFNIGLTGLVLQFSWHFLITVSRILSLSMVASIWPLYVGIACSIHWMIMNIWILVDSHGILEFCRNYNYSPHLPPKVKERIYSVFFAFVLAIVHVFIYLNSVDGKTIAKHIIFYILCFLENTAASTLWALYSSEEVKSAWYFQVLIVSSVVPFVIGIVLMVLYYIFFHPTMKKRNYTVRAQVAINDSN